MTATAPRSGLRERLRWLRRSAAAALAATALLLGANTAAASTPTPTPEPAEQPGVISVVLSPSSGGIVSPGEAITGTVTIRNDSETDLGAGEAVLTLGGTALTSTASLHAWLDAGTADTVFTTIATVSAEPTPAGATNQLSLPITGAALGSRAPGVYPLALAVTDASNHTVSARSVLVVRGSDTARRTAVMVPVTATPADGVQLTAAELAALTKPDGALTAQLDAVAGTDAVLALDPAIGAAIEALGADAPATAAEWLTRVEGIADDTFLLQYADADLTAQAQAGLEHPLEPFRTATVLPETAHDIIWPSAEVTGDTLNGFATFTTEDPWTVLPSTSVRGHVGASAIVHGHRVLIADADASDALSAAAAEPDPAMRGALLAEGAAHLMLERGDTVRLVALERDETRTAEALRAVLSAVSELGTIEDLASLTAAAPHPVALVDMDPYRGSALDTLLGLEQQIDSFASILEDPTVLTDAERIRLLRTIRVPGDKSEFEERFAENVSRAHSTLNAVSVQPPSDIHLISAAVDLPVWVRNDLPWPVTVTLTTAPSDTRLEVQRTTVVEAGPQSSTRVRVPVVAKIGSGELDVRLSLASPTGVPIGSTQIAHVSVRAEWEGIGLIILGLLVAGLLTLGIIRTVRKRRRADATREPASHATPHPTDPEETT